MVSATVGIVSGWYRAESGELDPIVALRAE